MATIISKSAEDTAALGERWGREAGPGSVFGLTGGLGAGKTELVRGLARGLQIPRRVHSPSFTLVHEYTGGRLVLWHLDLYRLETPEQIIGAGLEPYLNPSDAVAAVEWAERWFGYPGSPQWRFPFGAPAPGHPKKVDAPAGSTRLRWVRLTVAGETERHIEYEDFGS